MPLWNYITSSFKAQGFQESFAEEFAIRNGFAYEVIG